MKESHEPPAWALALLREARVGRLATADARARVAAHEVPAVPRDGSGARRRRPAAASRPRALLARDRPALPGGWRLTRSRRCVLKPTRRRNEASSALRCRVSGRRYDGVR